MLVITGGTLAGYTKGATRFRHRLVYSQLIEFLGQTNEKICLLYGLRRTGKTTLLRQAAAAMPPEQTASIKIKEGDSFVDLEQTLEAFYKEQKIKYVFIDEITRLSRFIDCSSILADAYANLGLRIVCSGTDSLGFYFASLDSLFRRCVFIHTTFISFAEYCYLRGCCDIDRFIEVGGTLDDGTFSSEEATTRYTMSAIAENIQRSLQYFKEGDALIGLHTLYTNRELTNIINRIVEDLNHEFAMKVIMRSFKSYDLNKTLENYLRNIRTRSIDILANRFTTVLTQFSSDLKLIPYLELKSPIDSEILSRLFRYLNTLELVDRFGHLYIERLEDNAVRRDETLITQMGLRFSQVKTLAAAIVDNLYESYDGSAVRLANDILNEAKGRILEEWVIYETQKVLAANADSFLNPLIAQVTFSRGEFNMMIVSPAGDVELYEIKHSAGIHDNQIKNLIDNELCTRISRFGKITKKAVLYRGKTTSYKGIEYINITEYLMGLHPEIPAEATNYF